MLRICAGLMGLTAGTALAAPQLDIGQSHDYRTDRGATLRMVLEAVAPEGVTWGLFRVRTDGPVRTATIIQDTEFRILRYESGAGVTVYDPHNCEHVVGICSYTVTKPDGTVSEEMRINGIEDGVWNYSLWKIVEGVQTPVGIGHICYDAAGISLWERWTDLTSPASWTVERTDNTCPVR